MNPGHLEYRWMLEFWFEFASPYSYVAAMRIQQLCDGATVPIAWKPFMLGPIFEMQGWGDSHFNLNPLRGAYMWRDLERLTEKFGLPWRKPSAFPRSSALASKIACAFEAKPWCADFIRQVFVANFGEDRDISTPEVVGEILAGSGQDPHAVIDEATSPDHRGLLRANTERAIELGIFGAPNCVVAGELFWGEEALEDAIVWARTSAR